MSARRPRWQSVVVVGVLVAAVVTAFWALYANAARVESEERATPAVEPSPGPVAQIAALDPANVKDTGFEDHPAVQVLRERSVVWAWSLMINDASFAQVFQHYDAEGRAELSDGSNWYYDDEYWVPIGPAGRTVLDVVDESDGSVRVTYCSVDGYRMRASDGLPDSMDDLRQEGRVLEAVLSPPTAEERAEIEGWGLEVPAYRFRESSYVTDQSCDGSTVVLQRFVDWEEYAPLGAYDVPDRWGVRLSDGQVVPREDMP